MTTQISFLGKSQLDAKNGYLTRRYRFDDGSIVETAFFGLALARKLKPERLVLLGTSGSRTLGDEGRLRDTLEALMKRLLPG